MEERRNSTERWTVLRGVAGENECTAKSPAFRVVRKNFSPTLLAGRTSRSREAQRLSQDSSRALHLELLSKLPKC